MFDGATPNNLRWFKSRLMSGDFRFLTKKCVKTYKTNAMKVPMIQNRKKGLEVMFHMPPQLFRGVRRNFDLKNAYVDNPVIQNSHKNNR